MVPKLIKSLMTLAVMGIPVWVVVVGVLRSSSDTGSIVVLVDGPGVTVWIDGRPQLPAAQARQVGPVEVAAGEHRVRVEAGGVVMLDRRVTVEPYEQALVQAPQRPLPHRSAAAAAATTQIVSAEEAGLVAGVAAARMSLQAHAAVTAVASADHGRSLVTVSSDGILAVWNAESGRILRSFPAHMGKVSGLIVLPDGRRAVTAGDEMQLCLWNLETGQRLRAITNRAGGLSLCLAASRDGRSVALGSAGGLIQVFDMKTGRETHRRQLRPSVPGCLAFAPNAQTLLVGQVGTPGNDHPVLVWNLAENRDRAPLVGHKEPVWGVTFLPDGRHALSGGGDRTLRLWDVPTAAEQKRFEHHPGVVSSLALSPDGRFALTGTGHLWANGWVAAKVYGLQIWDLEQGRSVGRCETPGPVDCVAFSADGRRVVAGGEDRRLRSWDLSSLAAAPGGRMLHPPVLTHASPEALPDPAS